jgi:hypothetical protein
MVFVDNNKNGLLDGTDHSYTDSALTVTICAGNSTGGCANPYETTTTSTANGTFTTSATPLTPGTYTVFLGVPTGYGATIPKPPVATVTVGNASTGTPCSVPSGTGSCDANGNVINLNFGITDSLTWIQIIGGDASGDDISNPILGGFTDTLPKNADLTCSQGSYALAPGEGGTHGVLNVGSGGVNTGQGQVAAAQSWVIGGLGSVNYPYVYDLPTSGEVRTSYDNLTYLVNQSGLSTTPLNTVSGCNNLTNCQLPTNFPGGTYTVSGDLTLTSSTGSYTFPSNSNYVILVNGKVNIKTQIIVPDGSFVLFSSSDDINVESNVGVNATSTNYALEGYYSTDKSFNVEGIDPSGNGANCASNNPDLRLNVLGSIVVNAVTANGGGFYYERDMCVEDNLCPVFTITENPYFILNGPAWLMFPRRVWQEVAP